MKTQSEILALKGKTVLILKPPFDDGYLDKGMFADVAAISWDQRDGCYSVLFDLKRFESYNDSIESSTWRGKDGVHNLTAKQADMYPEHNREQFYMMPADFEDGVTLQVVESYPITIDSLHLPELPHSPDSLSKQIEQLVNLGDRLGLKNAAQWVRSTFVIVP